MKLGFSLQKKDIGLLAPTLQRRFCLSETRV